MTVMTALNRDNIMQFIKYACVGVLNTLITLVIIYLCKSVLEVNMWVSNLIGYVAGLINSFIWNKTWVFHSHNRTLIDEMVRFFAGWALCYGLQLGMTWIIHFILGDLLWDFSGFTISSYGIATLMGMVFYTLCNYLYNRFVTFK
ncbi:MAG: GtrA family protein [Bacteroides sp.]|nr:GtrA family protein [Barnesiella sp.]MBD5314754.1 GtrA family protein [Bacteroides sp.]